MQRRRRHRQECEPQGEGQPANPSYDSNHRSPQALECSAKGRR
jgi:hypothetical protein